MMCTKWQKDYSRVQVGLPKTGGLQGKSTYTLVVIKREVLSIAQNHE